MGSQGMVSGRLLDRFGVTVGVVCVSEESGFCSGEVELDVMPEFMVSIFRRYEEIVNGQMFSFLDEIEAEIAQIGIRFAAGKEGDEGARRVDDLQIYPSTGGISFRLV